MAIDYVELMVVPSQLDDTLQNLRQHNAKYGVEASTTSAQNKSFSVPAGKVWFLLSVICQNNDRATYHKVTIGHNYVTGKTGWLHTLTDLIPINQACSIPIFCWIDQLSTVTLTDYNFTTGDGIYRVIALIELDRSYFI